MNNEVSFPVVVLNWRERKWTFVDFSVPWDGNVVKKEDEKVVKYEALGSEIGKIYKVRTEMVPIVIGALGTVPKRLEGYLKKLDIPDIIGGLQTSALLGSIRILRNIISLETPNQNLGIFSIFVLLLSVCNVLSGKVSVLVNFGDN